MTRIQGSITKVLLPRGFAFIQGDDGNEYFLHADQFDGRWDGEAIQEGARVEFVPLSNGTKGNKLRAGETRVVRGRS